MQEQRCGWCDWGLPRMDGICMYNVQLLTQKQIIGKIKQININEWLIFIMLLCREKSTIVWVLRDGDGQYERALL